MTAPLVAMRTVGKTYGAVRALHGVDLTLAPGEVLGLVGDNAAGKSTLMKILAGAVSPDTGEIRIAGAPAAFDRPTSARAAGIEMVHQDFALVPHLTVTQNVFLGRELLRARLGMPVLDREAMDRRARELFAALGLRVPSVTLPVRALSGGQQQAVAIARATGFAARLVIMDEPTANLGAPAIAKVRETILRLKAQGVAVILISHRLEDVFAVADAVQVMKRGEVAGVRRVAETTADEILGMIVTGRDPARGGGAA
jgi:simple sugar transport system ATP-binding protein